MTLEGTWKITPTLAGTVNMDGLFVDNDNEVILEDLKGSGLLDLYLSAGTVDAHLESITGVHIAGSTASLSYITGTNGRWEGTIQDTITLVVGIEYDLVLEVISVSDVAEWRRRYVANYRRE